MSDNATWQADEISGKIPIVRDNNTAKGSITLIDTSNQTP